MKVTIKAWLHAEKSFFQSEYHYKLYPFASSIGGSIALKEIEVEVEVPEGIDLAAKERESLEQTINQLEQDHANKMEALKEKFEALK